MSECLKQHKGGVDAQQHVALTAMLRGTRPRVAWAWLKNLRW